MCSTPTARKAGPPVPCYRLATPSRFEPKPRVAHGAEPLVMCDACITREPLYQEWRAARAAWSRALARLQRAWVRMASQRKDPPSFDLPFDDVDVAGVLSEQGV